VQPYFERLSRVGAAIDSFARLLDETAEGEEAVFHAFLKQYPILLDVYGEAVSKPRFVYPPNASPLGKAYVEPDFVIRYPGNAYRLVELERPGKLVATASGQPRADVTQATFQIAEWRAYIANHYDQLRELFPGISSNNSATVVISRGNARAFGAGRDMTKYKELLRAQFAGIEVLTYDDLIERAREAYARMASLGIGPATESKDRA
jgi:hypothetical protein